MATWLVHTAQSPVASAKSLPQTFGAPNPSTTSFYFQLQHAILELKKEVSAHYMINDGSALLKKTLQAAPTQQCAEVTSLHVYA